VNLKELTSEKVFIIADIGKNFIQEEEVLPIEVYLSRAKRLIKAVKDAGADAVKFQTHEVEDEQANIDVTSPHFQGSDRYNWVKRNTEATPLEQFWKPLKQYCDEIGIIFFSTPMSKKAAQKLNELGVELWKVGSGDILDFVTLDYIASTGKPIIFSSGMSTEEETEMSLNFLRKRGAEVALLHCVSKYPCPPEELNLGTIKHFQKKYPTLIIGFSDHSVGIDSALAAVVMGARIIEKHFSFDREHWGSDHKVSLLPEELKKLVDGTRMLEKSMGVQENLLQEGESVFRPLFRKTLVASQDLREGTIITADMLYAMRPQAHLNGLPSEKYEEVVGKRLKEDLRKFDPISKELLE
jgi:N,N'-diacetyllegionaminate synthase